MDRRQDRSRALIAGLAIVSLALTMGQASPAPPSPAGGGELTPVRFRFDWISTVADTPVLVAKAQGFFEDAGLDVITTTGSGSTDSVTLTGAGQHDLAVANSLAAVVGVEQGIPVKSVGVLYQTDANGLLSLPTNPVNSPQELEGKRFGLQQGSSLIMYQALLGATGIDRSKVIEVPIGFGVEPLLEQQIDAMINFGDGERILVQQQIGEDPVFLPLADYGVDPYGQTLIANSSFAEQRPEVVKAFLDAYARGLAWAIEHPDEATAILQEAYPDVDPETLALELPIAISYWANDDTAANGLLHQDPARWQRTVELARDVDLIESDVNPEDVYTNDYLPTQPVTPSPAG
jgi:ABC-type nitrate/sulfonate/bicarbonate transport system substrate-binding protein